MAIYGAFADQIRAFANSADERVEIVGRKILIDLATAVVLKSPVGDPKFWKRKPPPGYVGGRFRANWQYGFNKINGTVTHDKDKSGQPTIARLTSQMTGQFMDAVHYITNSLVYANELERGHSRRQAPYGMVRVTILEFDPIVRRAAQELSV